MTREKTTHNNVICVCWLALPQIQKTSEHKANQEGSKPARAKKRQTHTHTFTHK